MSKAIVKNVIIAAAAIYTAVILIVDTKNISETVIICISNCLNTLIPSMFGFMVLTDLLIRSGLGRLIFYLVFSLIKRIGHFDLNVFTVFMLSQIGGYPVGIRMLDLLISENKNYCEIYDKMTLFCYSSGPAFIFGIIGTNVYSDAICGLFVFLSCFISNFIVFLLLSKNKRFIITDTVNNKTDISLKNCSDAVISSAKALFSVCACMICFNALTELITFFCSKEMLSSYIFIFLKSLWEITNIKYFSASFPVYICAFLCSFGGCCVIFQIYTLSDGKLKVGRFIAARAVIGMLSGVLCYLLSFNYEYKNEAVDVFGNCSYALPHSRDPLAAICLIIMTIFVLTLLDDLPNFKKNKKFFKKQ